MFINILLLVIGMVLLVKGADFFVDGSSKIATALKIPPLIIGLTLVSLGTSAPEISVNIASSLKGLNDMAIGNVVGSNIFNTLLILGINALIIPLLLDREVRLFNLPFLVIIYLIFIIFVTVITPLTLDIYESVFLIMLTISYTIFLIYRAIKINAKKEQFNINKNAPKTVEELNDVKEKKEKPLLFYIILTIIGLLGVIFGGTLVVNNASEFAIKLGMSESLVALTIVSVGTSLPELVTGIVASVKKENDMAVGNIMGSNIFNIILILGISSSISSLTINPAVIVDIIVMIVSILIIFAISLFSKKINRIEGALLVMLYIGYLTYIIIRN